MRFDVEPLCLYHCWVKKKGAMKDEENKERGKKERCNVGWRKEGNDDNSRRAAEWRGGELRDSDGSSSSLAFLHRPICCLGGLKSTEEYVSCCQPEEEVCPFLSNNRSLPLPSPKAIHPGTDCAPQLTEKILKLIQASRIFKMLQGQEFMFFTWCRGRRKKKACTVIVLKDNRSWGVASNVYHRTRLWRLKRGSAWLQTVSSPPLQRQTCIMTPF